MNKRILIPVALWAFVLLPNPASAWPKGPGAERVHKTQGPHGKARMQQRMKDHRAKILRKRLGLDETRAGEVEGVLSRFDPQRDKLLRRKKALRHRVQALLTEESEDEAQYEAAIREFQKIEESMLDLRVDEMKALKKVLSARERIQLQVALHRMQRRMKEAIHQRREGKRRERRRERRDRREDREDRQDERRRQRGR